MKRTFLLITYSKYFANFHEKKLSTFQIIISWKYYHVFSLNFFLITLTTYNKPCAYYIFMFFDIVKHNAYQQ